NSRSVQNISSSVAASADPFLYLAAFNFNPVRYRFRGYDADNSVLYMNGIAVENIENESALFSLFGGLNDVLRNRETVVGLRNNGFSFGGIGVSTQIDSRPQKQRKQNSFAYTFSNGMYKHKISFTHSSGINKKGWSFVFSGSRRWSNEGYVAGTYFDAWNGFMGLNKKLGLKNDFSLVVFATISENGRQGFAVAEMDSLAGTHYYNPYWGYQNGKKRNANVVKINQPYFIFTHEYKIRNNASLITAVDYSSGDRGAAFLDWYNAPDPRPDYYRYLPGYQTDAYQKYLVQQSLAGNINNRQINWQRLYDVNRAAIESIQNANGIAGNIFSGKRSHYVLAENMAHTTKFDISSTYNSALGKHAQLSCGASYHSQNNRYYKKLDDLLGGDFFVDLNQFAERTYPLNNVANQNDLNRPNRILSVGDQYGWDYNIITAKTKAWLQTAFAFNRIDFFIAAEIASTKFKRIGNVMSGLFPNNSFGVSPTFQFPEWSSKAGITLKINGRNYLYANTGYLSKAPTAQNIFISSRTRNEVQNNLNNENILSAEAGYILNAPKIKLRLTGYFTSFKNQLDVMSFYDDDLQNFVNYALNNISKLNYGTELGVDVKLSAEWSFKAAASVDKYYYNSRPNAIVTIDNTASLVAKDVLYLQNYFVGGMPQQAYNATIQYQRQNKFFLSIAANYFADMWIQINPIRRTYRAVQNAIYQSNQWNDILAQTPLQNQYTINVSGAYTMRVSKKRNRHKTLLVLNGSINNLLNNQNITSGASEQFRFDFSTLNTNKFPPKYYYYYGLNFMFGSSVRF
ncbi:MAG TPA: TonB-dependent receptor, partial [Chitinophagaceae bacterium]|nr:TonB-dependent receptor [Chitinophagaceae bacterium]